MAAETPTTRIVLLVEDNPADADIVQELLTDVGSAHHYQVLQVARVSEAVEKLKHIKADVILLDLRLPDASGVQTVSEVRKASREVPIVVLTGADDEELAMSCMDAGAQDYLSKGEIHSKALRRAIGYAITRIRETQVRELQQLLDSYRALSSSDSATTVTSMLAGSGALRERHSNVFEDLVKEYIALLDPYLDHLITKQYKPRERMEIIATRLGELTGGPRDLLDIHVAALDKTIGGDTSERERSFAVEGRLLALEMMGILVDFYRVGLRRRFVE
jgi:DNA-binding response OmpR family regulator